MSENATGANDPTDSAEQAYDSAAAAAIARDRLADELDPSEFGKAREVSEGLAALAADLRDGDLTVHRLDNTCTDLELLYDALRDVSELHGWGWSDDADTEADTDRAPAVVLDAYDVSRDDLGTSRIDVSDALRVHVYDEGDDDEVAVRLDALGGDVDTDADTVTLTATAARRLRAELGSALEARDAERQRYDGADE